MVTKRNDPPTTHTIQNGDILFDIAQAYYGDGNLWGRLSKANGNIKPEGLIVGNQLNIPKKEELPQEQ